MQNANGVRGIKRKRCCSTTDQSAKKLENCQRKKKKLEGAELKNQFCAF